MLSEKEEVDPAGIPRVGATGHVGIVVSDNKGGIDVVAAGHSKVYRQTDLFSPRNGVIYQRYIGRE